MVTVVLPEQRKETQALLRKAGIKAAPQDVNADSTEVLDLVGEVAPYQAPAPKPVVVARNPQPRRSGSGGGQRRRGANAAQPSGPRPGKPRRASRAEGTTIR